MKGAFFCSPLLKGDTPAVLRGRGFFKNLSAKQPPRHFVTLPLTGEKSHFLGKFAPC